MDKTRNYKLALSLIITSVFVSSCLDNYTPPEIVNSEPLLVVEGSITNNETRVILTKTSNLAQKEIVPVENASVKLENETGDFEYTLQAEKEGNYKAIVALNYNDKYRIHIKTNGDEYVSEFSSLLATPPIDSIGWEKITNNKLQVQVSTKADENFSKYYLWSFEESWIYDSKVESNFIYKDGRIVVRNLEEKFHTCWNTVSKPPLQIGTSVNLEQNVISKQPIHEIDITENSKLSKRYRILVKQYAITNEAFMFWNLLKKNTENVGTLFDSYPSLLPTNIRCVNNPNKTVIGFIFASQEQSKITYINRSELPFKYIINTSICQPEEVLSTDSIVLNRTFSSGYNLIAGPITNRQGILIGYKAASRNCADCRLSGGTTEKPDFWID